ncbi:MAG: hypothetical protein HY795_02355 [Desulfovibrio sp.]|jgi:hypothetical protein|nr:hypothetical protein [Desulfovibrio sp.]MBI4804059.1 hypothetical protein [Desulfovibrio sp.]MBI4961165.1 hypothetical protein [Desulfovibrio sp.]
MDKDIVIKVEFYKATDPLVKKVLELVQKLFGKGYAIETGKKDVTVWK